MQPVLIMKNISSLEGIVHTSQLLFVRIQEIEVKNPGDFIKTKEIFGHGKKCQNYDFWLINKSVNSYITQKST